MFFIRLLLYQISFLANWTFISFKKKINQWNNLSFSYFILSLMHSYHSNNTSPFFHHSPFTPLWFLTLISLYSSLTRSFVLALGFFHPSNSNVVCLHSNYFSLNFIVLPLHIDGPSVCWINNCILHLLICAAAVASCRICATTATVFLGGYTAWICAAATTVFLALRPLWFGCLFVLKLTCHLVSYLTSKC